MKSKLKNKITDVFKKDRNAKQIAAIPEVSGVSQKEPDITKINKTMLVYKPTVNIKLIILLIENTQELIEQKERIQKIVTDFLSEGKVIILNYGKTINISELKQEEDLDNNKIFTDEVNKETTLFYDTLVEVEKIVREKYLYVEETEKLKIKINEIKIIGFGTCKDTGSETTKKEAIKKFYEAVKYAKIATEYYCITEEFFVEAAEIGFYSIKSISMEF